MHDLPSRSIARDVNDTTAAVCRLKAESDLPIAIAIESNAASLEVDDRRTRRTCDTLDDLDITELRTGGKRVVCVQTWIVVGTKGGSHPTLRPCARDIRAEGAPRQYDAGFRREMQRCHQAG